jgi:hypothetical protein
MYPNRIIAAQKHMPAIGYVTAVVTFHDNLYQVNNLKQFIVSNRSDLI